jgi:hypothetical protein
VVVDPMLQPVVRTKAVRDPKHNEFAVSCKLCGTRVYARPDQVGQQLKCPDCHSPVDIVAPRNKQPVTKGPTLDDAEEVPMSHPGQRPAYRPIVRPEGEDAVLALLNDPPRAIAGDSARQRTPSAPRQPVSPGRTSPAVSFPEIGKDPPATGSGVLQASDAGEDDDDDSLELRLSDPVERPVVPVELPHHIAADLPDPRDEGSYGDELWEGSGTDDGKPRWQKSPFLVGVIGFLLYPTTLGSWIGHSLFCGALLCLLQFSYEMSQGGLSQLIAVFSSIAFAMLWFMWGCAFTTACLAVVQDTANGIDAIENWPDWNFMEWIGRSFTFFVAAFVSSIPGLVIASTMLSGGAPLIALPLPILASLVACLPIVLCSILVEDSILSIVSANVIRMVKAGPEGWILFYMLTGLIGILAVVGLSLLEAGYVGAFLSGAVGVTLTLLYMRLLGRLLWYSQNKLTEAEAREESRRRWSERASRPS